MSKKNAYLGSSARKEIIENWSAKKEAINLLKVYENN